MLLVKVGTSCVWEGKADLYPQTEQCPGNILSLEEELQKAELIVLHFPHPPEWFPVVIPSPRFPCRATVSELALKNVEVWNQLI